MVRRMGVNHVKFCCTKWINRPLVHFHHNVPGQKVLAALALLLVFGFGAGKVSAESLTGEAVVARLQEHYNTIKGLEADFEQETVLRSLNQRRLAEGRVYFKKPGRMRWNYLRPDKQEIVSDGALLWIYSQAQKQVYRYDARVYLRSQLTMNFFLGQGDFRRDFVVSMSPESAKAEETFYVLTLLPRQTHPQISEIKLWIGKDTFLIDRILSRDHLGNATLLRFKKQQINKFLDDGLFVFAPPTGAEIIYQDHF